MIPKNSWFIGNGNFAALCLENFMSYGVNFAKIITGLPTRSGRNNRENPSPVETFAISKNLQVTRTGKISQNQDLLSEFSANTPELIFVIDFGQIIREPLLTGTTCVNIHPSMLPKYRGAAPIQRALLNGDEKIGVTLFRLAQEMDAGNIFAQSEFEIQDSDSAQNLYGKLANLGVNLALEFFANANPGNIHEIPQDNSRVTYANKLDKSEFELSFEIDAQKFFNSVRALNMSGAAYITLKKSGKRLKIWSARKNSLRSESQICGEILSLENNPVISCEDFSIELLQVQPEAKKIMTGKQWSDGLRLKIHEII